MIFSSFSNFCFSAFFFAKSRFSFAFFPRGFNIFVESSRTRILLDLTSRFADCGIPLLHSGALQQRQVRQIAANYTAGGRECRECRLTPLGNICQLSPVSHPFALRSRSAIPSLRFIVYGCRQRSTPGVRRP